MKKICWDKREGRIEILWTLTTAQERKLENKKGKRKKETAER